MDRKHAYEPKQRITMKTGTTLLLVTTITGALLFSSCTDTAADQADKMENKMDKVQDDLNAANEAETRAEYERDRNDVLDRLYTMRSNIDKKWADVNERLEKKDLKADKRAEQEALKAELESNKTEVARLITSVENSAQGTWIDVKEETREASDKVENWWDRTKDNVDEMTKSDKDADGK